MYFYSKKKRHSCSRLWRQQRGGEKAFFVLRGLGSLMSSFPGAVGGKARGVARTAGPLCPVAPGAGGAALASPRVPGGSAKEGGSHGAVSPRSLPPPVCTWSAASRCRFRLFASSGAGETSSLSLPAGITGSPRVYLRLSETLSNQGWRGFRTNQRGKCSSSGENASWCL